MDWLRRQLTFAWVRFQMNRPSYLVGLAIIVGVIFLLSEY